MNLPARLRHRVVERANNRCEYCGLSQDGQEAVFHIDHVVPRSARGKTMLSNLALACVSGSLRKAARLTATDPETSREMPLLNPRREIWNSHFRWRGTQVVGTTPTDRATVVALKMNRSLARAIREEEVARKRHPPTT